jgi:hypothetical protein
MPNEPVLYLAVSIARERMRTGTQPAAAAAFAPVLGLSADTVRTLATRAEDACKQTRAELHAEKEARALRGEQEPTL